MLVTFGIAYALQRYILAGLAGFVVCVLAEALLTTNAAFMDGPRGQVRRT